MRDVAVMTGGSSDVSRRKALLMVGLLAVFTVCAWLVGGVATVLTLIAGMGLVFVLSPGINPRVVMRLHRAERISPNAARFLHRTLCHLASEAGLSRTPELYWLPSNAPNVFATGDSDDAAIALSEGSLRLLNRREMTGVLAHEVAHIANGDGRLTLFTEIVRRAVGTTALVGLAIFAILLWSIPGIAVSTWLPIILAIGPGVAFLLQRALSRTCEFAADIGAVALTDDPRGLAAALAKFDRATRNPWMRLFRVGLEQELPSLLQTHPETGERIRRLVDLEPGRRAAGVNAVLTETDTNIAGPFIVLGPKASGSYRMEWRNL